MATPMLSSSLVTSDQFNNFFAEGGKITTVPWVGLSPEKGCDAKSKCKGFTMKGAYTIMTNMEGLSSMTMDATVEWPKQAPGSKAKVATRNFN